MVANKTVMTVMIVLAVISFNGRILEKAEYPLFPALFPVQKQKTFLGEGNYRM